MTLEKAVAERIGYLERHKVLHGTTCTYSLLYTICMKSFTVFLKALTDFLCQEAMLFRLSSLQQQLSECVPATELQKANR